MKLREKIAVEADVEGPGTADYTVSAAGTGGLSGILTATFTLEVVKADSASGAPTGLTVIRRTDTSVDLSWTAPEGKGVFNGAKAAISAYTVYYSQDSLDEVDLSTLAGWQSSGTASISIGNLQGGTDYYFVVTAKNKRRLGKSAHRGAECPYKNAHHRPESGFLCSDRCQGGRCNRQD